MKAESDWSSEVGVEGFTANNIQLSIQLNTNRNKLKHNNVGTVKHNNNSVSLDDMMI